MLIVDVPEVKLFLLMIAEIVLYLIAYLCNRKNKDMYIRLFKISVLMTDAIVLHLQQNLIAKGLLEILQQYKKIQKGIKFNVIAYSVYKAD